MGYEIADDSGDTSIRDRQTVSTGACAFPTTQWRIVVDAGGSPSLQSREALAALCSSYWKPLYAFLRRSGNDVHTSEDLVQGFFARLIEKQDLEDARPTKGRFRSFLLASLKHFAENQRDRERAKKRWGNEIAIPLDVAIAEQRYSIELSSALTPDQLYEKHWAMTVLDQVLAKLRQESLDNGVLKRFERLQTFLYEKNHDGDSYAKAAVDLGLSEAAFRKAIQRLRARFAELLRSEIAQTVSRIEEIDDEIQGLIQALSY